MLRRAGRTHLSVHRHTRNYSSRSASRLAPSEPCSQFWMFALLIGQSVGRHTLSSAIPHRMCSGRVGSRARLVLCRIQRFEIDIVRSLSLYAIPGTGDPVDDAADDSKHARVMTRS